MARTTIDEGENQDGIIRELTENDLVEGKRSKKGFFLRPQPSNDPNDPLVGLFKIFFEANN
jgi:hypothetical protein